MTPRAVGLAVLSLWWAAGAARAANPGGGGELDDPKMARRLKTRISVPAVRVPATTGGATGVAAAPVLDVTSPGGEREIVVASPGASSGLPRAASADVSPRVSAGGSPGIAAGVEASPANAERVEPREQGRVPFIGLGYRRFSFVQVGATSAGSSTGAAASEPFDSISLDLYPISRFLRFGLSTQYGWQNGRFDSGTGDYFLAQSASLGIQIAGPRVTPFAEAFAGGGYMRRFQFDRTIPTAYWQFGIDAGANIFLADHGFFSVALGYLRPVNGFLKQQTFTSVYVDTWSVKIGFGL